MKCNHCGSESGGASLLCHTCGALSAVRENLECETHGGVPAIACCFVCGKPVCGDCSAWKDRMFFCDIKDHQTVGAEWSVVAECSSAFEADMIVRNLHQGGIDSRSFERGNHGSSLWFQPLNSVHVRVRSGELDQALQRLAELALDDNSRKERTYRGQSF